MVVAGADGATQSGKPGPFHQTGINRELRPGHAAAVQRIHVLRIGFELLFFEYLSPLGQQLDSLFHLWIGGPGSVPDETIIAVVARIHAASLIEIAHENSGQQMIHRERIVGMLFHDLLEFRSGAVILHVVKVIESRVGSGIMGRPVHDFHLRGSVGRRRAIPEGQQRDAAQSSPAPTCLPWACLRWRRNGGRRHTKEKRKGFQFKRIRRVMFSWLWIFPNARKEPTASPTCHARYLSCVPAIPIILTATDWSRTRESWRFARCNRRMELGQVAAGARASFSTSRPLTFPLPLPSSACST